MHPIRITLDLNCELLIIYERHDKITTRLRDRCIGAVFIKSVIRVFKVTD